MLKEEEKVLNQSLAALDQFWTKIEGTYPLMCLYSSGIPEQLTEQEREILQNCCKLIAWELSVRNIQKKRSIKCSLKHKGQKYSFVEINTISGSIVVEVETSKIVNENLLSVSAYATLDDSGNYIVFMPTEKIIAPLLVNNSEIVELI
jgi:hypothetical protein